MSDLINLFKTAKVDETKLVGDNNFFHTSSEIYQLNKLQKRFISNVDYSNPQNFAKFGSAEEYYKTSINYINFNYPLAGTKETKLGWLNELSDFDYYFFNQEYPKQKYYIQLSGSGKTINVTSLKTLTGSSADARASFSSLNSNNFVKYIDLENDGFTYETWFKHETGSSGADFFNLLTLNGIRKVSGSFYDTVLMKIIHTGSQFYISGNVNSASFSYSVPTSWQHYAFKINTNNIKLFVNGQLTEEQSVAELSNPYKYRILSKCFVLDSDIASASTESFGDKNPIVIGGSNTAIAYLDETRLWVGERAVEQIGRNWFTYVDGNDFSATSTNNNLLVYFKYNEEFTDYEDIILDYSGYDNHAVFLNRSGSQFQFSGSAIDLSGVSPDVEEPHPIIAPTISSSQALYNFYTYKIETGADYDTNNMHNLYRKFPAWLQDDESVEGTKHLKQITHLLSVYFDDLYNKITELSKLKHVQNTDNKDKIYPFYDTVLASTGFDVKELFDNLNVVEKVLSRQEQNIFDVDTQKVKNYILQNIYNNLAYILKGKGTEKSIRAFLRTYGLNENLVRINLYADKGQYNIQDKNISTVVKKKTLSLFDKEVVYMSGSQLNFPNFNSFTIESCFILPIAAADVQKNSLFGLYCSGSPNLDINVGYKYDSIEDGYRFYVTTGSYTNYIMSSSMFTRDIFDNTTWNLALKLKPKIDDLTTATAYDYSLELFGTNQNSAMPQQFHISSSAPTSSINYYNNSGFFVPYVGAVVTNFTGSTQVETYQKSLYNNVWGDYLDNDVIVAHNKDITNYGFE